VEWLNALGEKNYSKKDKKSKKSKDKTKTKESGKDE
jgi:hypothetical protein